MSNNPTMSYEVEVDGIVATVTVREGTKSGWLPGPAGSRGYVQRAQSTGIYVWEKDESVLENLALRTSRPVDRYRLFAEAALARLDPTVRLRWDRHCGCSTCPCSPGFRPVKTASGKTVRQMLVADGFLPARQVSDMDGRFDIHISVGARLTDASTPEAQARLAQLGLR